MKLTKVMKDYNASDLNDLIGILDADLNLEDEYVDEDELPQQEKVDLDKVVLVKEPAVLKDDLSCPFIHSYFQAQLIK